MRIDSYSFGRIVINGTNYTSDVIIYPGRVDGSWWRTEGHRLRIEDLDEALKVKPEVLIIGTGYSGVMTVPKEVIEQLARLGIKVKVGRTGKAVKEYNDLQATKTVVAALHLTC